AGVPRRGPVAGRGGAGGRVRGRRHRPGGTRRPGATAGGAGPPAGRAASRGGRGRPAGAAAAAGPRRAGGGGGAPAVGGSGDGGRGAAALRAPDRRRRCPPRRGPRRHWSGTGRTGHRTPTARATADARRPGHRRVARRLGACAVVPVRAFGAASASTRAWLVAAPGLVLGRGAAGQRHAAAVPV